MEGPQGQRSLPRLASGNAIIGCLDSVIHRIADDMCQRILDGFKNRLIEFGIAADHLQPDFAATLLTQIADNSRQFAPDVVNRLHAGLHDTLLQLTGDQVQSLGCSDHAGIHLA